MRTLATFILALAAAGGGALAQQAWAWDDGTPPFVVSPPEVVDRMLHLAAPKQGERLIDLGSGDGRIVIEAAKRFGAIGLGVDIDPKLVELATANASKAGVGNLARFEVRDLFETDLRGARVVTMYLLPEVNRQLVPRLFEQLLPGARVLSHDYDMGPNWLFDEMVELKVVEKLVGPTGRSRVFLWVMPANARGTWVSDIPGHGGKWTFTITQQFQVIDVDATVLAGGMAVRGSRLRGEEIRLAVVGTLNGKPWNHLFWGIVTGARIDGELRLSDGEISKTIPWTAKRQ